MIDSCIANVIIFNRSMGSQDESSSDEEQGEKILYYYPSDTSLSRQVGFFVVLFCLFVLLLID